MTRIRSARDQFELDEFCDLATDSPPANDSSGFADVDQAGLAIATIAPTEADNRIKKTFLDAKIGASRSGSRGRRITIGYMERARRNVAVNTEEFRGHSSDSRSLSSGRLFERRPDIAKKEVFRPERPEHRTLTSS